MYMNILFYTFDYIPLLFLRCLYAHALMTKFEWLMVIRAIIRNYNSHAHALC